MRSIATQSRILGSVAVKPTTLSSVAPRAAATFSTNSRPSASTSSFSATRRAATPARASPQPLAFARTFATSKMVSASRIKVQNPVVEMDGDEMTVSSEQRASVTDESVRSQMLSLSSCAAHHLAQDP